MRGVLSSSPGPASIRLLVGGYLLLMVQGALVLQAGPTIEPSLRAITVLTCALAFIALLAALRGESATPAKEWWRRDRAR